MRVTDTSDLWWRSAVFYNLDVETFMDWNDDGVGDLEGLAHRIDYLAELGVSCLWLAPFYPSPGRDNGYDISDFFGVDRRYGHHGDVVEVLRTAHDRGMRVIVDLVVNHTSDQHPWFQAARSSPDSPYRDYYLWRDEPPADQPANVFPDAEDGVWFFDEQAGQYYLHNFYRHQPDLNTDNPAVRDEIAKLVGFWLQLGVDGFRVDAVPFLITPGAPDEHEWLRLLRRFVSRRSGEAMMLGEVNLGRDEQLAFFGGADADELSIQFDFIGNQRLYLALARGEAAPLVEALASRPAISTGSQWANFVRNHDELTLDQLSEPERDEVFAAFAPEESQRIHGRGIVRRLPPMLDGDPRRIRMIYSLLFSLPGVPVLYYGEEIGMGENPSLPGRGAVRSPMQWSAAANGGFSRADADDLVAAVTEGGFGPEHVNAADQLRDSVSLLAHVKGLAWLYRRSPEIGWGDFVQLPADDPAVFAHQVSASTGTTVAVHNLASSPCSATLRLPDAPAGARLVDSLSGDSTPVGPDASVTLPLDAYGARWFRLASESSRRLV
ncbi:alpha-amylase family protein [Rathayibacter sp. VKM Ac-2754]|uniref:alpha-amylase family protein n=1 Tax=Rathayibacter sp. VKM Ac-2754 TaxID=2609251 RepID=UPI001356818F|nr:alpha-amylase family protein [Rathayibacter sp. VKM Ac-2754]MWV60059.1 trehalose synthase [Rathayibacter sp. VKM Ac-2754]